MTDLHARMIAVEAFQQNRHAEDLGQMSDLRWAELCDQAGCPEASVEDQAAAVEYLRIIDEARRR